MDTSIDWPVCEPTYNLAMNRAELLELFDMVTTRLAAYPAGKAPDLSVELFVQLGAMVDARATVPYAL